MDEITNVVIVGAGALGAAYASRFAEAPGVTVAFHARGTRYDRLRAEGMVVNGLPLRIPVIHPRDAPFPAGLVIVALKDRDLPEALPDLRNVASEETVFLSSDEEAGGCR
jgi:2-dehydropantoate 2-reductase